MNKAENKLMNETQTTLRKILDFLIGFLGSLIVGNVGIVWLAQFDTPERLWISSFTWFWRFALAGLAVFLFTRKRIWISIGIVMAILLQAFGI
jgi:hypothetical protein